MAGADADRELSDTGFQPVPHGLKARVTLRVATAADDAALRRLLRENPMRGAMSVAFEREPDFFRGAGLAGADEQTIVAHENERLVCMGRCVWRDCWVNGRATRTGYLGELRLDHAARGRFGILRDGYRFFRELARDDAAELYFTSIAADNERARRLLESGARGLPTYKFLAELDTLLVAVPRHVAATHGCDAPSQNVAATPSSQNVTTAPRRRASTLAPATVASPKHVATGRRSHGAR